MAKKNAAKGGKGVVVAIVVLLMLVVLGVVCAPKVKEYQATNGLKKLAAEEITGIREANVGDIVKFGNYNDCSEWQVLAKEENQVLLVSSPVIEMRNYNDSGKDIVWENCDLRVWLNNDYFQTAFSEAEQSYILESELENADNPEFGIEGGNPTVDKVFLLSIDETERYLPEEEDRVACRPDGTAVKWWLRSPGVDRLSAAYIYKGGYLYLHGGPTNVNEGVRPAMWVEIE